MYEDDKPDSLGDILDDETLNIVDGKSPNPSPSPAPDMQEEVKEHHIFDSVELVIFYGPPCSVSKHGVKVKCKTVLLMCKHRGKQHIFTNIMLVHTFVSVPRKSLLPIQICHYAELFIES
jgi:hypothetical protein